MTVPEAGKIYSVTVEDCCVLVKFTATLQEVRQDGGWGDIYIFEGGITVNGKAELEELPE